MAKYKKKPVIIDAYTFDEVVEMSEGSNGEFQIGTRKIRFLGLCCSETGQLEDPATFLIETLEGDMTMTKDDMLIVGVRGEAYPCKIDIFNETYEIAAT